MAEFLEMASQVVYLVGFVYGAYCIVRMCGISRTVLGDQCREFGWPAQPVMHERGARDLSYYV